MVSKLPTCFSSFIELINNFFFQNSLNKKLAFSKHKSLSYNMFIFVAMNVVIK